MKSNIDYVNAFIGTTDSDVHSLWESNGGTYPGAVVPFGMAHATPDAYKYDVLKIKSFSLVEQISGYPKGSSGSFKLMPFIGEFQNLEKLESEFKHENEKAYPGYYSVFLENQLTQIEMTATKRNSFFKLKYPPKVKRGIVLMDIDSVMIVNDREIRGKCSDYYFVLKLDQGHNTFKVIDKKVIIYNFNSDNEVLKLKIGLSLNSIDQAINNQEKEIASWNFEDIRKGAKNQWEAYLNLIHIEDASEFNKEVFYTALYHSLLDPQVISDLGSKVRYANLSPWDTYRSKLPFLTFLTPNIQENMIHSVLDVFEKEGIMDPGPMTGDHNVTAILDAYVKGVQIDSDKSYKAMYASLMKAPYSRLDMDQFLKNGFVSSERSYSVTKTLEYAHNYWALGQMAIQLGKMEDQDLLHEKSYAYTNIYNPNTGFMMAKDKENNWDKGGFREGDKWAYNWSVTYDIQGIINLSGGKNAFLKQLEESFEKNYYYHDNEPPMHNSYLFSYAGEPWKTQKWVNEIRKKNYTTSPGGISGNDDLGALSSWYIFSALGFYPVSPGRPEYIIGTPQFDKVEVIFPNNKKLIIEARNRTDENIYVQSVKVNGKSYKKLYLAHFDLINGAHIIFNMGPNPKTDKIVDPDLLPKSFSKSKPKIDLNSWKLSQDTVSANEPFLIHTLISNNSEAFGTEMMNLKVDGKPLFNKCVLLSPGELLDDKWELKLYSPGKHILQLNQLDPFNIYVKHGTPATYEYKELKLPKPPIVSTDSLCTIKSIVKNVGNYSGLEKVALFINDKKVEEKELKIEPGETRIVIFNYHIKKPNLYKVRIGTLKNKTLLAFDDKLKPDFNESDKTKPIVSLSFNKNETSTQLEKTYRTHGDVKFVKGIFGNAIQTNALENSYIEILSKNNYRSINEGIQSTIMLWVKPINETNFSDIISYGDQNVIQVRASNTEVNYYSGSWRRGEAYSLLPSDWNNKWHHIAGVSSHNSLKLYIDGELLTEKPVETVQGKFIEKISPEWNIGRNVQNIDRNFNGLIDEVKIFDQALEAKEIRYQMFKVQMK